MPWVPWERTASAIEKASSMVVFFSAMSSSLSLGMTIMVSTLCERVLMPSSADFLRLRPSKVKGFVTTATVSAPMSFMAMSATMGAAPVPVPPPSPAVMNTMSAPASASLMSSRLSSADLRPISGLAPGAEAAGDVGADVDLDVGVGDGERLGIGVDGDELDAADALLDHAVDRVGSAAADADHLDDGKIVVDLVLVHAVLRCAGLSHVLADVVTLTFKFTLKCEVNPLIFAQSAGQRQMLGHFL